MEDSSRVQPANKTTAETLLTVELSFRVLENLEWLFGKFAIEGSETESAVPAPEQYVFHHDDVRRFLDQIMSVATQLEKMLIDFNQSRALRRLYHPHPVTYLGNVDEPHSLHDSYSEAVYLFALEFFRGLSTKNKPQVQQDAIRLPAIDYDQLLKVSENSPDAKSVHRHSAFEELRKRIHSKRFDTVKLGLLLQREYEAVADLLDEDSQKLKDGPLIDVYQLASITGRRPTSFGPYKSKWGPKTAGGQGRKNGTRRDKWKYREILPVLKTQFPDVVNWPDIPPAAPANGKRSTKRRPS